jgi:hypothetical protein
MDRVSRLAKVIVDDDRDGVVTLDLERPIPATSIWVVVEQRSGRYGITAGPWLDRAMVPIPLNALRKGGAGVIDRIAFDHAALDLLYVHLGQGAWTWSAMDGDAAEDADGANGTTVVSLSKAHQVNGNAQDITAIGLGGGYARRNRSLPNADRDRSHRRPADRRGAMKRAFAAFALVLCAGVVHAQHPNDARGFEPGQAYNVNGNLTMHVLIGPSYTVNGVLSYRLGLFYNSHVWKYEQNYDAYQGATNKAIPLGSFNAGLGWTLSLRWLFEFGDPESLPQTEARRILCERRAELT